MIVAEQLGVPKSKIRLESSLESSLVDDLGADELDGVELIMTLEEEFNIEIPDEESEKITTVQSAIDFVRAQEKVVRNYLPEHTDRRQQNKHNRKI